MIDTLFVGVGETLDNAMHEFAIRVTDALYRLDLRPVGQRVIDPEISLMVDAVERGFCDGW
jgi:hypothetical protein